uniref:Odorant receptor n=1 Tax=Leucinodes orbonalis TaxID=711050 RepID=A0AAU0QLM7_9NEOP|nr:odorant receptor [Leucinodes orbonalis]
MMQFDNFSSHILRYTEKYQKVSTILSRMYYMTVIIYIFTPFMDYALFKFTTQEMVGLPHILPSWSPLDGFSFVCYILSICYEVVSCTYCVFTHVAFDLTSIGIMIFICGQFAYLKYFSEKIGSKHEKCTPNTADLHAHDCVARSHKILIVLMKMTILLNQLLKNILGVYFFLATLTLCSVAVRLNSELSSMQLVSILQYMCGTLTQLYLYCRFGDNVKNESSIGMGEGPFIAAHWRLSPKIRKELTLLGAAMMMPRHLYAGPFISLDLPSFIMVVRTAYSYYAVIRK